MSLHTVKMTVNASGAAEAAARGDVVVIVDLIDMSTSLESALDEGARAVFGAAPDKASPPVPVNPFRIGLLAGELAVSQKAKVVLVAEPRAGTDAERLAGVSKTVAGLQQAGARVDALLPNIGAEVARLYDLRQCVVIAATGTGGVAFDAAVCAGAPAVLTGTVARTLRKKGPEPARASAARAVEKARALGAGISVVAASGNSLEDLLAAEYLTRLIVETFT